MVNEEPMNLNVNEAIVNDDHEADMNEEPNQAVNENDINEDRGALNFFDSINWNEMDQGFRDLLVEKGPMRDNNVNFPIDDVGRHFSIANYVRYMLNGEKRDRKWLVYSRSSDKVFCFCCKLFKQEGNNTQLATERFRDWRNLGKRLKSH